MNVRLAGDARAVSAARQVALAGMDHLLWRTSKQNCSGYTDLTSTSFANHSYSVTISPSSGSPVRVVATGVLADGSTTHLAREKQKIFQSAKPTSILTTADSQSKDTYVTSSSWFSAVNFGTWNFMRVSGDDGGTERFSLLKFDLSVLPESIEILSANLQVYATSVQLNAGTAELSIHRMLMDWAENGATYETSDGSIPWTWPDLFYNESEHTIFLTTTSPGLKTWDITSLVAGWINSKYANHGVAIAGSSAIEQVNFDTSDDLSAVQVPTLRVKYTCECGLYCYSTMPLPNGLAHWKLDETSGATALDSDGNNDGTTYGNNWVAGQVDGAAQFDGSSDYINVPHANELSFNTTMTISAWINLTVSATGTYNTQSIIEKGTGTQSEEYWLGVWENELEFGVLDNGDWYSVSTVGVGFQPGIWYHVSTTFDSTTDEASLYVDGVQVGEGTINIDPVPASEDIQIGRSQFGEFWYGQLDDVRLFNELLSQEQIAGITVAGGKAVPDVETILDQFGQQNYAGSDGSLPWTGEWLEVGESSGALSGDEIVTSDSGRDFVVRLRDNNNGGEGIQREVDLSACTKAKLGFEYRRAGGWTSSTNDYVIINLSSDGGVNWTQLDTIRGPGNDTYYIPITYDISGFISSNTVIEFLTSPGFGNSDRIYLDNVGVRLTECN